jgi:hypothetical protein
MGGLQLAMCEIERAFTRLKTAAKVPGLWTFGPDRFALQQSLSCWAAAGVAAHPVLDQFHALLERAIAIWAGINAVLHSAVVERNASRLQDLAGPWKEVVHQERRIADMLESIHYAALRDGE